MVFTSLHFVIFFLAVWGLYRLLPHRPQNVLLLVASYYFYAAWDWRFTALLAAATLINFAAGLLIGRARTDATRTRALVVALALNLVLLGFFKYWNFFAENLRVVFGSIGWHADALTLHVLLPIGISFFTFMTMSYVVDVYRREVEPTRDLLDFSVFVAYFPHLVAGPILRASLLMPQIAAPRAVTRAQVVDGGWLLLWGTFKKVYVADNLAHVANRVFAGGADPTGVDVLLASVAFAFQVYGDFSGYTDIARGVSKLLGIELNLNFRFPYFTRSPQEFWAHWHISLSTWLRDYLFLPMSYAWSRRLEGVRALGLGEDFWVYAVATMVTMLLGGLWHGAAWNFVLWGAYQGLLLVVFRAAATWRRRGRRGRVGRATWSFGWRDLPAVLGMFLLTCYGWLIFRASSLEQVGTLTRRLFGAFRPSSDSWPELALPILLFAGPLLLIHWHEATADDPDRVGRWRPVVRYSVYVALAYLIVLFGDFEGADFIYFQF